MSLSAPDLPVDFNELTLPTSPNYYIAYVHEPYASKRQIKSPVFPVSAEKLNNIWQNVIASQERITLLASHAEEYRYTYQQKTKYLGFPDIINVQIVPLESDSSSSILMLSQSKYGYFDFGVNEKRVKSWLNAMEEEPYQR